MGAARAKWYSGQLPTISGPDPFEVEVGEVGELIDLSHSTARLQVRLTELVRRESELDNLGVSCDLKQLHDVVCSACPVSEAGNDSSELGSLCRVGREQEMVLTELAVLERGTPAD